MSEAGKTKRPQFRNIHITQIATYRLPVPGIVSILHRISGVVLFLMLPFILFLLDQSLLSENSFAVMQSIASNWFVKLVILGISWAYLHHFCAGIRHVLMDAHVAADKTGARFTAKIVLTISLVLTALVALKLFGAF